MLAAKVNGLLTTFDYDGDGNRLRMSVAGEVTTYTLDYAGGFRLLLEEGGAFSDTKHYLYGLACIGEHVDADNPATEEWRFYQRDGDSLVRQTTNMQATVTPALSRSSSPNALWPAARRATFGNGRSLELIRTPSPKTIPAKSSPKAG
jgi:hypothetical protein